MVLIPVITKILWFKSLLIELRFNYSRQPVVFCDNLSTQHLPKNSLVMFNYLRLHDHVIELSFIFTLILNKNTTYMIK